jgi:hypothetical protein
MLPSAKISYQNSSIAREPTPARTKSHHEILCDIIGPCRRATVVQQITTPDTKKTISLRHVLANIPGSTEPTRRSDPCPSRRMPGRPTGRTAAHRGCGCVGDPSDASPSSPEIDGAIMTSYGIHQGLVFLMLCAIR